mmetsp:Transcript_89357/g.255935  ORF Transcript_89357/g.255935 Transcript_89357/m.255935 type:complete len:236 (+) Transcript_89357:950-1657(+)
MEVVIRRSRVRHRRVGGRGQNFGGIRHAVLHSAVGALGPRGHSEEPQVTHGDVRLKSIHDVVLLVHPILLVHRQAPSLLLCEEALEELDRILGHGCLLGYVPLDVGPILHVIGVGGPLAIVHHDWQLQLGLNVRHAMRKNIGQRGPVGHCATTASGGHTAVLWVEPGVELPMLEGHTELIMICLHLQQHLLVIAAHGLVGTNAVVIKSAVVRPETDRAMNIVLVPVVDNWPPSKL